MQASPMEIAHLQNILLAYATSTGLKLTSRNQACYLLFSLIKRFRMLQKYLVVRLKNPFTYTCLLMGTAKPFVTDIRLLVHRIERDRKSTRLNSSHSGESRMPSSA